MKNKQQTHTTSQTCDAAEEAARTILADLFGRVFDKVVVHTNLIFPTGENSAVRSTEVDAVVVCNAGMFIFEVKGWTSCAVVRQKTQAGTAQWSLRYPDNIHPVRDPVQQLGGKLKAIAPLVKDAVCQHINQHAGEVAAGLDALSGDHFGQRVTQSVKSLVAKIDEPNIRMRSYVFLPMGGVDLPLNVPANVIGRDELPLVLRQLRGEVKREKAPKEPFTDDMVDGIAAHLAAMGSVLTPREHLQNIRAVHW